MLQGTPVHTSSSMAENVENKMSELEMSDKKKGKKTGGEGDASQLKEMAPPPEFIEQRLQLWNKLKKEYGDFVAAQPRTPIKITLPDGKQVDAKAWETTPYDVAKGISQGLADNAVVAKVNGEVWDLDRPFEKDATLELVKFDSEEGQYVFWHSSAHILGETMERLYGGHLCYGPPIENGFYYDMWSEKQVSSSDYPAIENLIKQIVKEKQPFERLEMKKEDLLEMFKYNKFKQRIINEKVDTPTTTVYRCGPLIDLCRGPHVRHTGKVKACMVTKSLETKYLAGKEVEGGASRKDVCENFSLKHNTLSVWMKAAESIKKVYVEACPPQHLSRHPLISTVFPRARGCRHKQNSATYWEGKADMESLQRIYGISFPDTKQLKEWKQLQEEAAKRDHRKLGRDHELYFFHELSPGCCFFLPKGAHIYNTLIELIKSEYRKRGFQEVVSPNIYNSKLWETSGHWQHYSENMFSFEVEKETYALKPMNCPGHCLMFDHRPRSWKELPLRLADFGVLHRNELSGALSGLTRVRRFQQDDAHIFCMPEQIKEEIAGCLDFLKNVYEVFGFTFDLKLSTRPVKYLGEIEMWDKAEKQLAESLDEFGWKWELNPGDGAFYGPKIDITIKDALKRSHQCATIQLDFQLPIRFNLSYNSGEEGAEKKRPVMIHRAILGSLERMIAILTENYGGKWPFWLSPRQAAIIPVAPPFDEYALKVRQKIHDAGFMVDTDLDPTTTLNKKVRNNQLAQYNFILVVGEKEVENGTVNVRTRDNKVHGEHSVEKVIERFINLKSSRCLDAEEKF